MGSLRLFMRSTYRPERLCALTDGVYAIVLTLLVLDLKSPEEPVRLTDDLLEQIPRVGAYFISFFALSYFWILHHGLLSSIKICDVRTVVGNLRHLLLVSLTPFFASLVGRYEDRPAVIAFSLLLGLTSWAGTGLAHYLSKHEDWWETDGDGRWVPLPWYGRFFGLLVAAVSIALSFVSIGAALALWLVLPLRVFFLQRVRASPASVGFAAPRPGQALDRSGSSGFRVGGSLGLDGASLPKTAPHGGEGPISGRLTPRLGLESRARIIDCFENAVWTPPACSIR